MRYFQWTDLLKRSRLPPTARLVGFVLATFLNEDGECWPAVGTLARGAGVSDRTVQRALAELRRQGYLWVEFRGFETSLYRAQRPPWLPKVDVDGEDDSIPF